jgi:biopolymer transport protein ExbB
MLQQILNQFTAGGSSIFMWSILGISLLASFFAFERYLALTFRYSMNGKRLFGEIKKYIFASDFVRALEVCRQHTRAPLAHVLGAGLANADQSIDEVETAMESEALFYTPKITERLPYLSTFANVATLMGLLGTIAGLITAFVAVGGGLDVGVSKEEALAGGIAVAMFTTAFGLIVAIPTMLAHAYLSTKANRLIDDIEHYSTALKQLIQRVQATTNIEFKRTGSDEASDDNAVTQKPQQNSDKSARA